MAINIFKDKNKLNRLINLRIFGFSEKSLAFLFGVDKSAVIYHFKKYHIKTDNVRSKKQKVIYDIPRIVEAIIPPSNQSVWMDVDGERINMGRTYAEYLALSPRNKSFNR